MIEFDDVQDLVSPVVIAAFEGWNDAADAASGLVDHLMEPIARDGYRMQTLISEIVTSYPFVHHRLQEKVTSTSHAK